MGLNLILIYYMAGGIFVDQPFHFNTKCVVFGIALMLSYWFIPPKQYVLLPLIFVVAYIAMAWYDHLYSCQQRLFSGTSPIGVAIADAWAKPSIGENIAKNMEFQVKAYRRNIHYLHIGIVMPIFILFSLYAIDVYKKNKEIDKKLLGIRWFLGILAILLIATHIYRFFVEQSLLAKSESPEYVRSINLFHIFGVGSILLLCSLYPSPEIFTVLGITGVIAGGYHLSLLAIGK